ncbi:MAG: glycosyltransferase [Chloroflexi bacterium]|nr:glycosyltransferase [Chloroflexota bacterium]
MQIALASIHPRAQSGQIEQLVGLAEALTNQGHTVTLVLPFPSELLLDGNRPAVRPSRVLLDQPSRIGSVLLRLRRLAPRVDIIHLNLPTPAFSMFADLLQMSVRVPVVVGYEAHLVGPRDLLKRGRLWQDPGFYLPRLLVNNSLVAHGTLHRARHYLVNSQYQKEELAGLGLPAEQVHIVPPILPMAKLERGTDKMRALFPPGRIITYLGHYHHVKGVDILLHAFQSLAPRFPDLYLALAWSGVGSARRVEQILSEPQLRGRVYPLGQVRVPDLLAVSDAAVLPYRLTIGQAAFPAALLEAMAALVPVVTTDLPLLREFTEGGRRALLVPPDDPTALAGGIERVLTQKALVSQMLESQRRWAREIEPSRAVRVYEELYQRLCANQAAVLRPARDREQLR